MAIPQVINKSQQQLRQIQYEYVTLENHEFTT